MLETKRLVLRNIKETDWAAIHAYAGQLENTVYMFFGPNSEEETKAFVRRCLDHAAKSRIVVYNFAIIIKETEQLIGSCDLHFFDKETAEIGWILHRDYWKQGYGTEIGKKLLEFGFDRLCVRRITAHCDAENTGSSKLMEKIGMRREALYHDVRPPHKKSNRAYSDEFAYAILKEEWEIQKEIAYYKSLPCVFNGFTEIPELSDGVIRLICTAKHPAVPEKKYVPSYAFTICNGSEKVGEINLRIGYGGFGPDESSLYYGGQIGYGIDEAYRGNGYAVRACRLLVPVAKAHNMTKLLITNHIRNEASRRVCEKLGLQLIRSARLPEWTDLYKDGQRFINIYEWTLSQLETPMPIQTNKPQNVTIGSNMSFGSYDWRVLDIQGGRALLLSELALEERAYHEECTAITWENCTLRHYLNNEFFFNTFNAEERGRIHRGTVINNDNPWTFAKRGFLDNAPGGNNTQDHIFLLSIEEVVCYFGGADLLELGRTESNRDGSIPGLWYEVIWEDNEVSRARIAYYAAGYAAGWASRWLLRSPGDGPDRAADVGSVGSISVFGCSDACMSGGVRPALWLNLES